MQKVQIQHKKKRANPMFILERNNQIAKKCKNKTGCRGGLPEGERLLDDLDNVHHECF